MLPDQGEIIISIHLIINISVILLVIISGTISYLLIKTKRITRKQNLNLTMNRILENYLQEVSREKKQNTINIKKLLKRFLKGGADIGNSSYAALWTLNNETPLLEAEYKEDAIEKEIQNELNRLVNDLSPDIFTRETLLKTKSFSNIPVVIFPTYINSDSPAIVLFASHANSIEYRQYQIDVLKDYLTLGSKILENILIVHEKNEKDIIKSETIIAGNIQQDFIPNSLPETRDLKKVVLYKNLPGINSDYFDIVSFKNKGKTGFVLCHVAGKGLHSALVMVMIYSIFHFLSRMSRKTGIVLELLNKGLMGKIGKDRFAAISYALFDPEDKVLTYSTAGQTPLLHFSHESGEVHEINDNTLPVGIDKNEKYPIIRIQAQEGDIFIMFTDGIIETTNDSNEQYGINRLKKIINDNYFLTVEDLKKKIDESLSQFRGEKEICDDMTLIIIKVF